MPLGTFDLSQFPICSYWNFVLTKLVPSSATSLQRAGDERRSALEQKGDGGCVMPIIALLQKESFDAEATHILTAAFDKAWDKFKSSGSPLAQDTCAPSTRGASRQANY